MFRSQSTSKMISQHKRDDRRSQEGGFTLVELAISLFIIGLIIGGVLKSEELIRIVQVRRVMADINAVSAGTKGFQDKYGSVPGDFPLAQQRIPNCNGTTNCKGGNGDGLVGKVFSGSSGWNQDQTGGASPQVETTLFWKHLVLAGFLKGVNPYGDPAKPSWTQTHPATPVGGGFTVFADTQSAGSSLSIRMQNFLTRGVDPKFQRPFTVKQAIYMDQKYDDGRAAAGFMWGIPYAGVDDPPCRKSWSGSNGENYNMDPHDNVGDQKVCQFHFIFH